MLGTPLAGQPLADDGAPTGYSVSAVGSSTASATLTATAVFSGAANASSSASATATASALLSGSATGTSTASATLSVTRSGLFRLGYINGVSVGTLTASTAEFNLPVSNLSDPRGSAAVGWQTTDSSVTNQWFRVDMATSYQIGAFVLAKTNLTTNATIRWQIFSDADFTIPIYDSGTINAGIVSGIGMSVLIGGASGQFVQCTINDASNPDNHINVAQAWIGPTFAPMVGLAQNSSLGTSTGATITTSKFGQSLVHDYWTARQWTVALNSVQASEWPSFQDLDQVARAGQSNILFIPSIASATLGRDVVLGTVEMQAIGFSALDRNARSVSMTITERL